MRKRDLVILLLAFAAAVAVAVSVFSGSALETGSWGLSFRQEGSPPIGTAGADQLRQFDAAYIGDTTQKVLYLTFDAGYENGCTEKILDVLKKHQVPAAFFLVGNYIEKNADLVRRMADEGHTVGKTFSNIHYLVYIFGFMQLYSAYFAYIHIIIHFPQQYQSPRPQAD